MSLKEERLTTCKACPYFTRLSFCLKCGCYIPGKAHLTDAKCPDNRWKDVEDLHKN